MAAELKPRLTFDEYLEIEGKAEFKSEFVNGEMYAMAGASPEHNVITANVIIEIGRQLQHPPCAIYSGDQLSDYNHLQNTICLAAINCELSLAEIYKTSGP